jgi:hypothetical protein
MVERLYSVVSEVLETVSDDGKYVFRIHATYTGKHKGFLLMRKPHDRDWGTISVNFWDGGQWTLMTGSEKMLHFSALEAAREIVEKHGNDMLYLKKSEMQNQTDRMTP